MNAKEEEFMKSEPANEKLPSKFKSSMGVDDILRNYSKGREEERKIDPLARKLYI